MQKIKNLIRYTFSILKKLFTKQNCCKCIAVFSILFSQKSFGQNSTSSQTDYTTFSQSGLCKISNAQVKDLHGKSFSTLLFSTMEKQSS